MDYEKFYDIAIYINEINWEQFTEREIACNAYDYLYEYELSKAEKKPTVTMQSLCKELVRDMDFGDYDGLDDSLNIQTMEYILDKFIEEL